MPWHYSQSFSYTAHPLCILSFVFHNAISPISLPGQATQYLLRYLNILFYKEFFGIKTASVLSYQQRVFQIPFYLSGISPDSVSRETSKDFPPDTATIQISTIFSARAYSVLLPVQKQIWPYSNSQKLFGKNCHRCYVFLHIKELPSASVYVSIRHHTLAAQIARHNQRMPEFTSDFLKNVSRETFSETKKQDSTRKQTQKIDGT